MYVRGMGRYRRGMGQTETICPGDPSCPGMMTQAPLTPSQLAALSASNAAYFATPVTTAGTNVTTGQFTQWLNANATTVLISAGVLLALAALK